MNLNSDTELVEAAQNGQLEGFGALYQRYYSSMVALAYSALGNRDLAEDAAQEVFAIACRDLAFLRRSDRFGAWLAGICRNVARQMLRLQQRATAENKPLLTESHDDQENVSDVIRQTVWRLPPAQKELIVLRYYDGFSHAQISRVLDIPPQAVNGRLVRAKRKIAEYLKRNGFTEEIHRKRI